MAKRLIFRIRWNKKSRQWALYKDSQQVELGLMGGESKAIVESLSRAFCRDIWIDGQLCQLVIHNKNGQIQRGNGEATYGRDPKRSRG